MTDKLYRLCYVSGNILYFTDNFENQCGDDWNDAPYEHNAEEPYEYDDDWTAEQNEGRGHIKYLAFMCWDMVRFPCDKGSFSVDDINKGAVPWLTIGWDYEDKEAPKLWAGATTMEAIMWLNRAGCKWGWLQ